MAEANLSGIGVTRKDKEDGKFERLVKLSR